MRNIPANVTMKAGHLQIMDDGPFCRPECNGDGEHHAKGNKRMNGRIPQNDGEKHAGKGDYGANRKVDTTGKDDEGPCQQP